MKKFVIEIYAHDEDGLKEEMELVLKHSDIRELVVDEVEILTPEDYDSIKKYFLYMRDMKVSNYVEITVKIIQYYSKIENVSQNDINFIIETFYED